MKIIVRTFGVVVGLLVVLGFAQHVASESGEVVVLTTTDAETTAHETRVWAVEHEGQTGLRAGAERQAWYGRLAERPQVEAKRNGRAQSYTAVPEPGRRKVVNSLMLEKYGWADQFIALLFGRDDAILIRLDPPQ